jgi:hypothetical protein
MASLLLSGSVLIGAAAQEPPDRSGVEPEWGPLSAGASELLAKAAERYLAYSLRFTADETVRLAKYKGGFAESETVKRYGYLLVREEDGSLREVRQERKRGGDLSRFETEDEEPFPPAYAWVFLFSRDNQPFFSYRERGERFDGFDWVREYDFRGALPFTDGKDIRQWEGNVLVDAATGAPLKIRAEPSRQDERIRLLFDRWTQAFNIVGFRLAPRPFGYRCEIAFRFRQDRLAFPTEMRYDTFRAISSKQTVPWAASTRTYEGYRFFRTDTVDRPDEASLPR